MLKETIIKSYIGGMQTEYELYKQCSKQYIDCTFIKDDGDFGFIVNNYAKEAQDHLNEYYRLRNEYNKFMIGVSNGEKSVSDS